MTTGAFESLESRGGYFDLVYPHHDSYPLPPPCCPRRLNFHTPSNTSNITTKSWLQAEVRMVETVDRSRAARANGIDPTPSTVTFSLLAPLSLMTTYFAENWFEGAGRKLTSRAPHPRGFRNVGFHDHMPWNLLKPFSDGGRNTSVQALSAQPEGSGQSARWCPAAERWANWWGSAGLRGSYFQLALSLRHRNPAWVSWWKNLPCGLRILSHPRNQASRRVPETSRA